MGVCVSFAGEDDLDAIAELNQLVQSKHADQLPWLFKPEGMTSQHLRKILARETTIMCVARLGDGMAGYAFAEIRDHGETQLTYAYRDAHLHHLSVAQRYQRRGVGSALVDHVQKIARERGARQLTADYWSFNLESEGLFEALGFAPYIISSWRH